MHFEIGLFVAVKVGDVIQRFGADKRPAIGYKLLDIIPQLQLVHSDSATFICPVLSASIQLGGKETCCLFDTTLMRPCFLHRPEQQ